MFNEGVTCHKQLLKRSEIPGADQLQLVINNVIAEVKILQEIKIPSLQFLSMNPLQEIKAEIQLAKPLQIRQNPPKSGCSLIRFYVIMTQVETLNSLHMSKFVGKIFQLVASNAQFPKMGKLVNAISNLFKVER